MLRLMLLVVPVLVIGDIMDHLRNKRDYRCTMFLGHHCYVEPYDPQCGSNNFTYYNRCEFSKEHCRVSTIHLAHHGACHNESQSGNMTHGQFIVLQYTCNRLLNTGCPDDIDQVCASDGRTYLNECEYELQRCMHPDLSIVKRAPCVA